MADFQTDVQTISVLVNQSSTMQEALDRFGRTEGFSIPKALANRVFHDTATRRFKQLSPVQAQTFEQRVRDRYRVRASA